MAVLSPEHLESRPSGPAWLSVLRSWLARARAAAGEAFDSFFADRRGNISRPKILFAISSFDALAVILSGIAAELALGHGIIGWGELALRTIVFAAATVAIIAPQLGLHRRLARRHLGADRAHREVAAPAFLPECRRRLSRGL
ncbi:MAG: hypothetical protein WDN31_00915 [Hyphomicrobium sp.]